MHTEDTSHCDIYQDVKDYPRILINDPVVQAFLERFPEAITTTEIGIDESDPPQAVLPYIYEYENGTSIKLSLRVVDCVDSNTTIYSLSTKNDTSKLFSHLSDGAEEIITLLENYPLPTSYIEREDWINLRGEIVSIFPSSVSSLLERGYLELKLSKN